MDLAERAPGATQVDRVIAAGQLDLGDAPARSSSDTEVALRSHEYLDTPGGTRDMEGSRPEVSILVTAFVEVSLAL